MPTTHYPLFGKEGWELHNKKSYFILYFWHVRAPKYGSIC